MKAYNIVRDTTSRKKTISSTSRIYWYADAVSNKVQRTCQISNCSQSASTFNELPNHELFYVTAVLKCIHPVQQVVIQNEQSNVIVREGLKYNNVVPTRRSF